MSPMPRAFSIYLDLVRFVAAVAVYLYHSNQRWLTEPILPFSRYGHSAVVIFFVLSGYVIAYVTASKEKDWRSYAANRLSRVYSVAVPAVVLTLLLDLAGRRLLPEAYTYPIDWVAVRSAAALLMANEVWTVSITTFSNVPYWSICYEAWYYVGFGIVVFARRRVALVAIALLALLLGPKIVLLAPVWMMGVVLFRSRVLASLSEGAGWVLALGGAAAIVAFIGADVQGAVASWLKSVIGVHAFEQLAMSRFFLADYMLGLLVTLHFAGMRRISDRLHALMSRVETPIRKAAAYTFTLYLLHQPLFLFWGSVLGGGKDAGYRVWALTSLLVAASVVFVGSFTETRRHVLTCAILRVLAPRGTPVAGKPS